VFTWFDDAPPASMGLKRRNVSTQAYRDGWARIFGHRAAQLSLRLEPAAPDVIARDYWESLGGKVFWTEKMILGIGLLNSAQTERRARQATGPFPLRGGKQHPPKKRRSMIGPSA
jgi:hypothetical protein